MLLFLVVNLSRDLGIVGEGRCIAIIWRMHLGLGMDDRIRYHTRKEMLKPLLIESMQPPEPAARGIADRNKTWGGKERWIYFEPLNGRHDPLGTFDDCAMMAQTLVACSTMAECSSLPACLVGILRYEWLSVGPDTHVSSSLAPLMFNDIASLLCQDSPCQQIWGMFSIPKLMEERTERGYSTDVIIYIYKALRCPYCLQADSQGGFGIHQNKIKAKPWGTLRGLIMRGSRPPGS